MKRNNIAPERIFVLLASVFGMLLLIITPPFEVPDEPEHLYRAYQISDLIFIGQKQDNRSGGCIPQGIVMMTYDLMGEVHRPGKIHHLEKASIEKTFHYLLSDTLSVNAEFVDFRNTVLYPPLVYIPQTLGVIFAKAFSISPLWMLYIGRLLNLMAFVIITYYTVKIIPVYKWGIVLLALMPMTLAQASSLSADSITFAVSFFLIAFILKHALNEEIISNSTIIKIAGISFLVGMCKIAYVLLPLLILLIPNNKFSSKKNHALSLSAIIFSASIGFMLWSLLVRNIFIPTFDFVKPGEQILFILAHPNGFCSAIIHSLRFDHLHSFVGIMGWLDTPIPRYLVSAYIGIIILCALFENTENITMYLYQKVAAGIIIILSFLLISIMIYTSWNRVGADIIEGWQGRYFIPIAPLSLLLFYNNKFRISDKKIFAATVILFLIISLIITISTLIKRYYI